MGLPSFQQSKPSSCADCQERCSQERGADEKLSASVNARRTVLRGGVEEPADAYLPSDSSPMLISGDSSPCEKSAATLGPTLRRFNRYRQALPYADAANAMNQLGDAPSSPKSHTKGCLTRLPDTGRELSQELGLPPDAIKDRDLRDDTTGFRAAMFRDEQTGKLILVARDTQPKSLVDWQTNTRNGDGIDTDQYKAMRNLAGKLDDNKIEFNTAGYSKGGGLAQEAALIATNAKSYVFNSAGLHEASLARTGNKDFTSLVSRTQAFSAENDFLTYMNETRDPAQQLANMQFLRRELVGENRWAPDPMEISFRNPANPNGKKDAEFPDELQSYLGELDRKITQVQSDITAGKPVQVFPPVRSLFRETIPKSQGTVSNILGASKDGPNLGKLAQHQMGNVLGPMQSTVEADRKLLKQFLKSCG